MLSLGLGPTNPRPSDVGVEPFSASVNEGDLARIFATTTKICTSGGSRPPHGESFYAHHRALLLTGASRPPLVVFSATGGRVSGECLSAMPFSGLLASAGELLHTP